MNGVGVYRAGPFLYRNGSGVYKNGAFLYMYGLFLETNGPLRGRDGIYENNAVGILR
jgi:hypothetical protein